jgi:hypothetical protein
VAKNKTELMIPDKFNGLQGVAGIAGVLLPLRRGRPGGGFANHKIAKTSAFRSALNTPPQPSPSQGRELICIIFKLLSSKFRHAETTYRKYE